MNENFKNIKGIIFDYGGTLDSEGRFLCLLHSNDVGKLLFR